MPGSVELLIDLGSFEIRKTPESTKLRRLLDYWHSKCPDGALPYRPDIEPGQMVFILPNIYLLNVRANVPLKRKYSFRLFGTSLVDLMGREFTSRTPHEVLASSAAESFVAFSESVTQTRAPVVIFGTALFSIERRTRSFECCQMPLIDQDGEVAIHLGGLVPQDI